RGAIPMLTLALPPSAPRDARVRRDGVELSAAALGVALPIDPGEHTVVVEAPGRRPSEQRFTVDRGQRKTVELTLGGAASAGPAPTSSPTTPEAPSTPAAAPGQAQRIAAFATGGVGAAGLIVGAVTGGLTLAKKGVIEKNCDGVQCNHEGKLAADSAKT